MEEEYLAFNEECWSRLTDNVVKGNYVLVLGNEAILDKERTGGISDSKEYFEKIRRERRLEDDSFSDLTKYDQILNIVKKHSFNIKDVSPDLIKILRTKCFRIVLTVNYDHYIETVMREIWGDELRVLDIFGDKDSGFDISDVVSSDEFYDVKPTLYYVFGKADPEVVTKPFSVTDNDSIEVIARWMNSRLHPTRLMNYLKNRELLAIGCKFSDWHFRFFWYCLRGDVSRLKHGQVAMSLNYKDISSSSEDKKLLPDASLAKYLMNQKVYTFPDAVEFQRILSSKLEVVKDTIDGLRNYGGVFVSYASEDSAMAALLFGKLKEQGFNVWIDSTKLFGGNSYDDRIAAAISQCKVFLPVLSPQVMSDIQSGNLERYYMKEWELASLNLKDGSMCMIPVALDGYDARSDHHLFFEKKTARKTVFELSANPISELYDLVKQSLQND